MQMQAQTSESPPTANPADGQDTLKDIRDVKVHTNLPKKERILDFISQIGDPYCYRYGDYIITLRFSDTGSTLEDTILSYLRSQI